VDGQVEHNLRQVLAAIAGANVAGGTQLVVFPETTLSGFPTRENVARVAQPINGPALRQVRDAAQRAGLAVAVGFAEQSAGHCFNTTVLIDAAGQIVLRYRKTHLWASDDGVFTPGDRFEVCRWNGLTVGLLICFDIEFPETARALGRLGAELLIVTNGNMDPYGPVHQRAIAARAMENQVFALMANRCGSSDQQLSFPGQSALVNPFGETVQSAGDEPIQLSVTLDLTQLASSRRDYRYLHDARVPLALRAAPDSATALVIPALTPQGT
jgi:(R)-amidase